MNDILKRKPRQKAGLTELAICLHTRNNKRIQSDVMVGEIKLLPDHASRVRQ